MPLHIETPLIRSTPLSHHVGADVWLKMESAQPSGSFKIRGLGHAMKRALERGATGFVSSSGGNAGMAVAWGGRQLGQPVTVVVPESTPERTRARIRMEGAQVRVHGAAWDEAHARAIEIAEAQGAALMHPFDHPDIWEGHATLIAEVAAAGMLPDCVVVSVGGGGLMCGVLQGMHTAGWTDVPVLAVETVGADSLAASVDAGHRVTLPAITSIAKTLGARRVAEEAFAWTQRHPVQSLRVSDHAAVEACRRFADDHQVLVEPSCGAALSLLYDRCPSLGQRTLVVVCGGSGVRLRDLAQ